MSRDDATDDEAMVRRTFRTEPLSKEVLEVACGRLQATPGIHAVEALDAGREGLRITYDARRLNAGQILERFATLGIRPADGMWQRVRLALLRLQDDNIRANLSHKPSCCSRPPPGAGKGLGGPRR